MRTVDSVSVFDIYLFSSLWTIWFIGWLELLYPSIRSETCLFSNGNEWEQSSWSICEIRCIDGEPSFDYGGRCVSAWITLSNLSSNDKALYVLETSQNILVKHLFPSNILIQPVLVPGIDISSQHILQIDFSTPNIQRLLNQMSSNWSWDPFWCRFLIYRRRPGLWVWR